MTTASETAKTELEAGTWSNFTDTIPPIYLEIEKVHAKNEWIQFYGDRENPVYAANDSIIFSKYECNIEIHARNRTDLDNMMIDIKNILRVSDENLTIMNLRDMSKRSKYKKTGIIKLIN